MSRLEPKDYYRARFVKPADPDTGVTEGYEGVVIEHIPPPINGGQIGCIVEVGPWDENGEPLVIVVVPQDHLERIPSYTGAPDRWKINQRWDDMEKWHKVRQKNRPEKE